ncbi:hypothetical protein EYC84_001186 [Monilinia fructicola]|uniref:Uncharacterized protein n=1 Tax=Monilinia fructicola TaxID=38448 RepID=A0A5M9JMG4_MONFR|nr:hypothetical protein EYC84_001186 [Monilinia fructicola]
MPGCLLPDAHRGLFRLHPPLQPPMLPRFTHIFQHPAREKKDKDWTGLYPFPSSERDSLVISCTVTLQAR